MPTTISALTEGIQTYTTVYTAPSAGALVKSIAIATLGSASPRTIGVYTQNASAERVYLHNGIYNPSNQHIIISSSFALAGSSLIAVQVLPNTIGNTGTAVVSAISEPNANYISNTYSFGALPATIGYTVPSSNNFIVKSMIFAVEYSSPPLGDPIKFSVSIKRGTPSYSIFSVDVIDNTPYFWEDVFFAQANDIINVAADNPNAAGLSHCSVLLTGILTAV